MGQTSSLSPLIGRKERTRWPDDNNFYEATITYFNPVEEVRTRFITFNGLVALQLQCRRVEVTKKMASCVVRWCVWFSLSAIQSTVLALAMMFCAKSPHSLYKMVSHCCKITRKK